VILQKETEVSENDTLGTVYFDRLFPMGVKAMLEAADLVVAGKHKEVVQDESQASYEGWFRANEAKIHWNNHVDAIHDTIRGSDPAPGAWTTIGGKKLQSVRLEEALVRTFGAVKGKIGEITEIGPESMRITAQGGQIEVSKVKAEEGKKVSAAEWAKAPGRLRAPFSEPDRQRPPPQRCCHAMPTRSKLLPVRSDRPLLA
jgi:methionyl-tRNA formyltransferase